MSLSVFNPAPNRDPAPTLKRALDELFLPHLISQGRSQDTIQGYRRYVRIWEEWESFPHQKYRMLSPVLCSEVRSEDLQKFREWLLLTKKFTPRNANKHVAGVQAVLAHCASWGKGEFAVTGPPKLPSLPHQSSKAKLYFRFLLRQEAERQDVLQAGEAQGGTSPLSLSERSELAELRRRDELSRLYAGCSCAFWPTTDRLGRAISPREHWRAAIVMLALYGFRLGELIATKPKHQPLTWGQVSWETETPVAGYHASNPHGWFWYVPTKQKWSKGDPLVLPLAAIASGHLRRIAPDHRSTDEPVFHWPTTKNAFYGVWSAILAQAGFTFKRNLRTGQELRLKPEHLRKTCDTWHNYHRPGIAPMITGHSSRSETLEARTISSNRVVAQHYDNSEFAVVEAIQSLPIPQAWTQGLAMPFVAERQLPLF